MPCNQHTAAHGDHISDPWVASTINPQILIYSKGQTLRILLMLQVLTWHCLCRLQDVLPLAVFMRAHKEDRELKLKDKAA